MTDSNKVWSASWKNLSDYSVSDNKANGATFGGQIERNQKNYLEIFTAFGRQTIMNASETRGDLAHCLLQGARGHRYRI